MPQEITEEQTVSNISYLGNCEGNDLRSIARDVDAGTITHIAVMYRRENGDMCYSVCGDGVTYLIGVVCRCAMHMHCKDSYVVPNEER